MVAALAFVALAWPSLGPLPWLADAIVPHAHAAADAHGADAYGHVDASAIPGSPTHPADHDCAECQVLKHLSRCILAAFAIDLTPAPIVCGAIALPVSVVLPATQTETVLPPVRAPPTASA